MRGLTEARFFRSYGMLVVDDREYSIVVPEGDRNAWAPLKNDRWSKTLDCHPCGCIRLGRRERESTPAVSEVCWDQNKLLGTAASWKSSPQDSDLSESQAGSSRLPKIRAFYTRLGRRSQSTKVFGGRNGKFQADNNRFPYVHNNRSTIIDYFRQICGDLV